MRRGATLGEIHLWNERLPLAPMEGPDLLWAARFQRLFRHSLRCLAEYVRRHEEWQDVWVFGGVTTLVSHESRTGEVGGEIEGRIGSRHRGEVGGAAGGKAGTLRLDHLAKRLGFQVEEPPSAGPWRRFVAFWENPYFTGLNWTFNPGSLKAKSFRRLRRAGVWISRDALLRRFGPATDSRHSNLRA